MCDYFAQAHWNDWMSAGRTDKSLSISSDLNKQSLRPLNSKMNDLNSPVVGKKKNQLRYHSFPLTTICSLCLSSPTCSPLFPLLGCSSVTHSHLLCDAAAGVRHTHFVCHCAPWGRLHDACSCSSFIFSQLNFKVLLLDMHHTAFNNWLGHLSLCVEWWPDTRWTPDTTLYQNCLWQIQISKDV